MIFVDDSHRQEEQLAIKKWMQTPPLDQKLFRLTAVDGVFLSSKTLVNPNFQGRREMIKRKNRYSESSQLLCFMKLQALNNSID